MKRKLVCCLLCAAMLLGLLTGCGSKTDPPAPTAAPTDNGGQTGTESGETTPAPQGKTDLRVAVNMDAPGFDPYTSGYNVSSALICRNVYETLLNLDAAGNLYAGLATDWEWGADNMSVILTIRQGVKFSNGEDLNADVVIFSLRDYRGKTAVGGEGESLFDFDNMKKLDDFKVEIPLKRAGSDAFITLTDQMYSICSKKAAEELGDNYPNNPVGTGPYKFVSFTSGVGAKLEANEDYCRRSRHQDRGDRSDRRELSGSDRAGERQHRLGHRPRQYGYRPYSERLRFRSEDHGDARGSGQEHLVQLPQ